MAIVYKIRRNSDGLFSMGGASPHFSKGGKIWKQKGHLTSHLGQISMYGYRSKVETYRGCEIVPYELVETPAGPGITISAYLDEIAEREAKKDAVDNERMVDWNKKKRYEQFIELQKEFT